MSAASSKKWAKDNPEKAAEKTRRWREGNPEKVKAVNAKQYKKNRPKILELKKKQYNANKEKHRLRSLEWQRNNPEKKKASVLKSLYGLSVEDYGQLLRDTGDLCPLCSRPFSENKPCVDHCHATGIIRGIICFRCNLAIGMLNDDVDIFLNVINHLEGGK